ncbi:alcohol dehydrogenase [Roridomyces roridus]|uniref:Alcohol dehydrogenase n=1 Tax=Roridomyces roridus TaxID=1738132 RepID=A0AAD7BPE9_9AGAR|nr:alcohol dehydrogenase [Roridomyces roridus]
MAPVVNARIRFNAVPKGYPIPGETTVCDATQSIDLEVQELHGGFLVKTLVLSIDPGMRTRMRNPEEKGYAPAFVLGEPIDGLGVGLVLRSENSDVRVGQYIQGRGFLHQEYFILPALQMGMAFLEKHPKLPLTVYVGALGMAGKTAWAGWKEYSNAKKGETVFVSAGAGPVGSMVIQLAKLDGCKVIASAGSADKVAFLRDIGADVAFNYKTSDTREVLGREGPVDIYWDNVGGDTLDAALDYAAINARFLECGLISNLNASAAQSLVIKDPLLVLSKSISLQGIASFRIIPKHESAFYASVPEKLAKGEIKYREDVRRGIESVEEMLEAVQKGTNEGKAVVVVAEE